MINDYFDMSLEQKWIHSARRFWWHVCPQKSLWTHVLAPERQIFTAFGIVNVRICCFPLLCMTETEYLWVLSDKSRNLRVVTLLIWMCNWNLLFAVRAKFNTFSSGRQRAILRAQLSILSDFYLSFLLVSNFSVLCSTPISSLSDVSHSRTAGATLLGGV